MKINEFDKQVTQSDIDELEKFADKIFAKVGIDVNFTRHFLDRVNDERNGKPISMSELTRLFKQEQKRWGKKIAQLGPDEEAVMKDLQTDINLPFALRWDDKNNELDLIAKTVMRKKNFRTPNPEFPVESVQLKENAMSVALDLWNIISSLKSAGWTYEAMFFLAGFTIAPGSIPAIIELWNREDDRIKIDRVKAIIKRLKDGSANKDDIEELDDYGKYLVQWLGGGEYRPDGKYNTYGRKRNEINSISYSMWMHIDAVARWVYRKLTGKEVRKIKIAKSNVPQVKKESINEEFGSVPPLAELILMAVVAKTSVDVLIGMFKVALKTGKGLKKLNDLRKRVTKMGQGVADYAMPHESVDEATKDELMAKLKDEQKGKFIDAALEALHRLVTSKGSRQTIGGYAFDIARAFNGVNAKELEKMYRAKFSESIIHEDTLTELNILRKKNDGVKQSNPLVVLDKLADRRDDNPFPIKFYDGETIEVTPKMARRFMNKYYDDLEPEQRDIVDRYITTKNGFIQAVKKLQIAEGE